MSPPASLQLARRILAYEADAGRNSEPKESAASRVSEKLRQPLCSLAGVAGFRSLLTRALALARAEAPGLSAVQIGADGSLKGLDDLAPQDDNDLSKAEGAILIAQLLGLLLTFVGEGITLRLVQNVWREAAFNDRDSEQEKKA
jgi:hypothetical protein